MRVLDVARVCHEANRAYCFGIGDERAVPWHEADAEMRASAVAGVRFRLEHPGASPAAQHEEWREARRSQGWVYGPVKDAMQKTHPCMVPWESLPMQQQAKDVLFMAIVLALSPYVNFEEGKGDES